ncbi:hypothetical protein M407DRAFT_246517 [Tulasnella calospora MUT 4182]|uniref:Uncharacterized protein n=1 Tax=Tulasnella calospora MUT 4182 TaxID=1051891 RepID=A0A0C3PTZ8_9AGAM|nr:hypothetical protein M407DRAFT_246517 [Tulasnella calospora MUT 4182]
MEGRCITNLQCPFNSNLRSTRWKLSNSTAFQAGWTTTCNHHHHPRLGSRTIKGNTSSRPPSTLPKSKRTKNSTVSQVGGSTPSTLDRLQGR